MTNPDAAPVALVTGAGRRLGRAMAIGLAGAGCDVAVHYGHSAEGARETVERIAALGRRAVTLQADVTRADEIARLFDALAAALGRLDVLVNSAAMFEPMSIADTSAEAWDRVLATNLRGPFLALREAAARMVPRGDAAPGLIVNIADLSAEHAWRGFAAHGVAKAGLVQLTRIAARELGPAIRVNAIAPGAILPPPGVAADDEEWARRGDALPAGGVGSPDDVVGALLYLVESPFVTGEVLHVDGGEGLLGPFMH